jgi:glycosyltransferase involved in cell wall biosynthesis
MAVNTPIVSLDVGDTREIIGDTRGCRIVEPEAGAVARAIADAVGHGRTTGRERLLALGLDIRQVAVRLETIYSDALARHGGAR